MITLEALRASVAELVALPAADVPDTENLVLLGLNSLDIMRLCNRWRREGIPASFDTLAATPTLEGWWAHLSSVSPEAGK